jgi:argininosuccinate lyase
LLKKDQNQAFILVMTTRYQLASVIAIHCWVAAFVLSFRQKWQSFESFPSS